MALVKKTTNLARFPAIALLALAGIALSLCAEAKPLATRAGAGNSNIHVSTGQAVQEVRLGFAKSVIVELNEDAKDILVSNPTIANAIVRSARRIFVIGAGIGTTNIFFFDASGRQIATLDVIVERDLGGLNSTLRRLFPNTNVKAEGIGENVIVSGQVNSASDVKTAIDVAQQFIGTQQSSLSPSSQGTQSGSAAASATSASGSSGGSGTSSSSRIVNALTILGKEQVHLKVVVAEMNRTAVKQLGVNLSGTWSFGGSSFQFNEQNSFPVNGSSASNGTTLTGVLSGKLNTTIQLRALEQSGLAKLLAEPSLTAVSGEEASFLAGGEFPVPASRDLQGNITVTFKQFGVGLAFTPVVLSEGRISIHTKTEVSELDASSGVSLNGLTIPGIRVRRAESTVELPSGGTIVLAGLIQDQTRKAIVGLPGLRRLPILGNLFSSQDFQNNQTELVVLITPYIANPGARQDFALPTDGFVNASDPEAAIFNRLNKIYGVKGQLATNERPKGHFGFIYE